MKTKLIISGLALMALTTLASAQNNVACQRLQNGTGRGPSYVDANKNGICDNFENGTPAANNGRRNFFRKGVPQGQKQGQMGRGRGRSRNMNFIDANKNGVCDYNEAPEKK